MPSNDIWAQYPIVAILILAAAVIAFAFYKLWHELLNWIEMQDKKREEEREKQRKWQAEQDRIRDERWQQFLENMQEAWLAQDKVHSEAIVQLIVKVDSLIHAVHNHDTWVRAKERE
jgi:esterase/lipase